MCIRTLLFLIGMSSIMGCVSPLKKDNVPKCETFRVTFEKGLEADFAQGAPRPVKSANVKIVDTPFGKGARIPKNGYLLYSLKENFPATGTLVMWMKPDWSSKGENKWTSGDWRGIFSSAENGAIPDSSKEHFNGSLLRAMQDSMMLYSWYGKTAETPSWYYGQCEFTAGTWHCYAFTWSPTHISFWFDGEEKSRSKPHRHTLGNANGFYLGSACSIGNKTIGFEGIVADATIYSKVLSKCEMENLYASRIPVKLELLDYAMLAECENRLRLRYHNPMSSESETTFQLQITGDDGKVLDSLTQTISLAPKTRTTKTIDVTPSKPGVYELSIQCGDIPIRRFKLIAISPEPLSKSMPLSVDGKTTDTLVEAIDCAKEYGPDKYRDDGNCKVEKSSIGAWRVAYGNKRLSSFIYLMKVQEPGKPHWLEIEYPDNAKRAFFVAANPIRNGITRGNGNLDTIGVLTGGSYPISNTMRTKRLLFWPDSELLTVGCYLHHPYPGERGPALSKIKLYKIEGELPRLKVNPPLRQPKRLIGVWNEDPTMLFSNWFNHIGNYDGESLMFWKTKWERCMEYLHYSGQNLWNMEPFAYHGDRTTLPVTLTQAQGAADRRHDGWADLGALMMQRENVSFFVEVQDSVFIQNELAGFGRLIDKKYYSEDFEQALSMREHAIERFSNDDYWTTSAISKKNQYKSYGCLLNPLHPKVQEAYITLVREYGRKFSKYKSFKGIGFIYNYCWSSLFFRNLDEGYGDYNIQAFERDTGIRIPVSKNDRERFSKRYDWLMAHAKEEWIQWRTRKLAEFYQRLVRVLKEISPDSELLIMDWPCVTDNKWFASWPSPAADIRTMWRERGIDLKTIGDIEGFRLMPAIEMNYERAGLNLPDKKQNWVRNNRYHAFSSELSDAFRTMKDHAVLVSHHSNFENYGGNFATLQVKDYFYPFLFNKKCMQCFSTPLPDNCYVTAHLCRLLADFNPSILYHGWWGSPDNGALRAHLPFYRAFRSIPMINFEKVPDGSDPVQIKYAVKGDSTYVLIVNREYYPVALTMDITCDTSKWQDVVDNEAIVLKNGQLGIDVKPYQVLCYKSESPVRFGKVTMVIPPRIIKEFEKKLNVLKARQNLCVRNKLRLAGLDEVIELAEDAFRKKHYSKLHYLLQSGPAVEAFRCDVVNKENVKQQ